MARLFYVLTAVLALSAPAMAQRAPEPPKKPEAARPAPQPTTLESLFARLGTAKDEAEARAIAKQIEQRWQRSGSDTANLLMSRVSQATTAKDTETAIELLDHILMLQPQWAEAYHRRATILYTMDDIDGALRDIHATLSREPRHFSALAGLGMIMQRLDNKKAAYAAFSKALDIYPQLAPVRNAVEQLKPDVKGRDL